MRSSMSTTIALALVISLFAAGAPASAAPPPQPPAPLLGTAAKDAAKSRYIVVLKNKTGMAAATGKASRPGSRVTHQYTHALNGFAAELSPSALDAVRRDPNVAYVEADQRGRGHTTQTNPPSWGLDRIDPGGLNNAYQYSATGEGVTVYVLDSGVRISHNEFRGRARYGWDFVDDDPNADDCETNSHGTHVAGTVAGAQVGVAKEARVVSVRVTDCDNSGWNSDVVAGLDWTIGDANRPAVVNLSYGSSSTSSSLDNAVRRVIAAGITVALSAGNDNENACDHSPARVAEAITVGATNRADNRAGFSNWGSCLDLFAPGVAITSASRENDGARRDLNGTSMASPHVAGLAAQYLQGTSGSSPAEVRNALVGYATANVVTDAGNGSPNLLARRVPWWNQVTQNTGLTDMFHNYGDRNLAHGDQCADWSGADGTQSIRLPSGKRAWFFSDTFLGNPRLRPNGFDTSMIRNSAIVQNGGSLRTITGGNTCLERRSDIDFWSRYARTPVDTPGGNEFYWTADGAVVGNNVVKFHFRNEPTPDGWWMERNTAIEVTPVSAYENNSVINVSPTIVPAHTPYENHPILWGISLLDEDPYYYIYGSASMDSSKRRRLFLARAPKTHLADFSSWYFYTGGNNTWSPNQSSAVPVDSQFEPTMGYNVAKINGGYWLIQKEPGLDGGGIVAHPASTPWGFSTRRVYLYTPPEGVRGPGNTWRWYYDARLHLGASGDPTKAVISYNVNSTAVSIGCRGLIEHDGRVYRPRFIDVSTSAFDPDVAITPMAAAVSSTAPRDPRGVRYRPGAAPGKAPAKGPAKARSGGVSALANDNNWYDAWGHQGGCPPLNQPTSLSAVTSPNGHVNLSWSNYGRDMWYWIERRDATANTPWQRMEFWRTSTSYTDMPITSAGVNGHTFEWRVVPFASGFGGKEAPASNVASQAVTIDRPAAPTGVTAAPVDGNPGTVRVNWNGVTYPSDAVYYSVCHWNKTRDEEPEDADCISFIKPEVRSIQVPDLWLGQEYGFYVLANNLAGDGPQSAHVFTRA